MEKAEFRNDSAGICGVVTVEPGGKPKGIAVGPGDTVWLTEEEQILTANAPRKEADNPFVNGTLSLVTEPKDIANRRPIGHTERAQPEQSDAEREAAEQAKADQEAQKAEHERKVAEEAEAKAKADEAAKQTGPRPLPHQGQRDPVEETGLENSPTGDAPEGERAQAEEVGTPEAEETPAEKAAPAAKPKPAPVKAK